ncbi:hypothetical protein SYNTR_0788 [Candidatus Syntrophocurvum alkaliphilum]|uniref:YkuS family protein n=1 Tax=Candidatus Syntrophocurvum alkaliphilum TaxID=2293317 RepID=A0A6I6DIP1_9FIRM|nr:YkuS family protein [Candidatus Syntrophocurvum alkaliphilum]QGT99381.1 hypothetical protein SYNTR_0788 [Candidatus Syntrophocurvum alkaliphilum]
MDSKLVAVEGNLSHVKDYLNTNGYQVIPVEDAFEKQILAVVISGADENLMGMQELAVKVPVINALGKTPEQILTDITSQ